MLLLVPPIFAQTTKEGAYQEMVEFFDSMTSCGEVFCCQAWVDGRKTLQPGESFKIVTQQDREVSETRSEWLANLTPSEATWHLLSTEAIKLPDDYDKHAPWNAVWTAPEKSTTLHFEIRDAGATVQCVPAEISVEKTSDG